MLSTSVSSNIRYYNRWYRVALWVALYFFLCDREVHNTLYCVAYCEIENKVVTLCHSFEILDINYK